MIKDTVFATNPASNDPSNPAVVLSALALQSRFSSISQAILEEEDYNRILSTAITLLADQDRFEQIALALYDRLYPADTEDERRQVVRQVTLDLDPHGAVSAGRGKKATASTKTFELLTKEVSLGYLSLTLADPDQTLQEADQQFFQSVANIIGIALKQARQRMDLEKLSLVDELTGCYNRRYMETALEREIAWAQRYNRCFSLVLLDIDGFKKVNDRHGHLAGDEVLQTLSQSLQKQLREADTLCRFGGDEFAIILPETTFTDTQKVIQRLLKKQTRQHLKLGDQRFPALSYGVSTFPKDGNTLTELLATADGRLYQNKNASRSQP